MRDAVAFLIAVRDIELNLLFLEERLEVGVDQSHGCGAVHVIVAVNQHFLALVDGAEHALDGFVHVGHQEGIVELVEGGTEESFGLVKGGDSALDKQRGKVLVNTESLDNFFNLLFVNRFV